MNKNNNLSSGKTVLVTGGAGFIGSHLVDRLVNTGYAVEIDYFDRVRVTKQPEGSNKELLVVFSGRLLRVKGLRYLIKSFKMVCEQLNNVHLKIFGSGPEEEVLRRQVANLGLENNVHFCGYTPRANLIYMIKKADLVVCPSLHEAQSMAVLEAMACHKPVLAFDIPSMSEIISNGKTGLLAKHFDTDNLHRQMVMALTNQDLRTRIGENAFNYVRENHNWAKQIDKYIKIYSNLV